MIQTSTLFKTVFVGTLLSTTVMSAVASTAPTPFTATYQFQHNGKTRGTATRTLTKIDAQQWRYVFSAKALGVASAQETSQFKWANDHIQSVKFNRTSKILAFNNSLDIQFNGNQINTKKDDESRQFANVKGALDELNAELQIRQDIRNGQLKSSYLITDAKEVEERKFIRQGNETVKTQYGTFDTVKVVMKHDKPGRDTTFWLAPKLDYLPVKVTHQDKKGAYGLLLTNYKPA